LAPRPVKKAEDRGRDYRKSLEDALSLKKKLAEAIASAGDESPDEDVVWALYAGTEKLVAVLKFKLGYETPGTFAKLPAAKNPKALLEGAERLLSLSAEEISRRKLIGAVESLREARNNLRAYLADKRRSRLKSQRESRKNKTSNAS
jgi:hypothetical protein